MFIEDEDGKELKITFCEGDWGIKLPIELEPEEEELFTDDDSFSIKIFKKRNEEPIITKTYQYSDLTDNTIEFELTETETSLMKVGRYLYDLDWYKNNEFLCNIIAEEEMQVIEKAGVVNEGNN